MKISGFHTTGPLKGTAKKMSDTELTAEMVKDQFCKKTPNGARRLVYGVTVTDLQVQSGRTDLLTKNDPRTFNAKGTISYKLLDAKDRLKKMQSPASFTIYFKEAIDELGQPDAKIISYDDVI